MGDHPDPAPGSPDFPEPYLGYAQSAFYGGRASAHVRKVPVPVVYTDFMSQYSTVNVLMGLWSFVTAADIGVDPGRARGACGRRRPR